MALVKQKLAIPFAEGIDTKTDAFQTVPTRLLLLENGVFTKTGRINKRNGYDILNNLLLSGSESVSEGRGLANFNDELVLFDGSRLLSFLDANERWVEKGNLVSVTSTNQSITKNPYQQISADFATNGNTSVYVWEDSRGGLRYTALDENSGTYIVSDAEYSSGGSRPKVFALGNYFVLTYVSGTNLVAKTVPTNQPGTLSSEIELATDLDVTDKIYDATVLSERLYFVYNTDDASTGVALKYLLPNLATSSAAEEVGEEASICATIAIDSSENVYAIYYDGSDLKAFAYSRNLDSQTLAPTVIETVSDIRNVTAIETSTDELTVLYEITNTTGGNPDNFVKRNTIDSSGTTGTASVFNRSTGLASKLFTQNEQQYVYLAYESELQSTYYVFSLNGDIISKANTNVGGGYTEASILPEVVQVRSNVWKTALLRKVQLVSENDNVFTRLGVHANQLDFTGINNFFTAESQSNLLISGGAMQQYDGESVVEQGFNVFPENVTATETNLGAGDIANGAYQYVAVYAWIDSQGQLHRSAPSVPVSITVSSGPSDVSVTVPTLRITKKEQVFIEVYRTEAAGTIFYKVTTVDSPVFNDKTADTVSFTDDTTDANLISNEILYTTGGVLENIAPPASSLITTFGDRVFTNDPDDPNVIRYSKEAREGFPVEFNDTLSRRTSSKGGDITAIAPMDDKLIIFKDRAIFYMSGDGPNNLGEQDNFISPQLITTDAGCIDAKSVVDTPNGLMFKSQKGIYLLTRSLSVTYIGAAVEDFNQFTVSSAVLVSDKNEVRFTTENNVALVYNYFYGQWSTFTNHEAQAATNYENLYTFVKSSGQVYQENLNNFRDGSQSYSLKLVTAWIQLAGVSGFQRVYKAIMLGTYKSGHRMKVKVGYDFSPNFSQEVTFNPETVLNAPSYGEGTPYGADALYGGPEQLYEWEINFKKQKCQAIRLQFEDIQSGNYGEGYSISHLVLRIGQKASLAQLGEGKSYGTS
jgi:hypothetical protein